MKLKKSFIPIITCLFFTTTLFAASNPTDEQNIKDAVTQYAKCIDKNDTNALDDILYDDANFIMFNKLKKDVSGYDKNDFIYLVKKGVLGGWDRNLNIIEVDFTDNAAVAKIEITDNKMKSCEYVSLIKTDGKWQVAGSTISIDKL